jgi:hypothetical protein
MYVESSRKFVESRGKDVESSQKYVESSGNHIEIIVYSQGGIVLSIHYDPKERIFHLRGKDTSYVMQIIKDGYLAHLYWGKRINNFHNKNPIRLIKRSFSPNPDPADPSFSLDTLPQEYPDRNTLLTEIQISELPPIKFN